MKGKVDTYAACVSCIVVAVMCSPVCVCWFVSGITGKLLNVFPQNLDGGRVAAQNRAL